MANIKLNRIDFRLVHGQVAGTWIKNLGIKSVIILSDDVGSDPFMIDMYKLAAPAGCEIAAYPVAEGCAKQGEWPDENTLVLFKSVGDALGAWESGYKFKELNVGQAPTDAGRQAVTNTVSLTEKDLTALRKLADAGVRVYAQSVPIEIELEFKDFPSK